MGHSAFTDESPHTFALPVAYFEGPKASDLARRYDGASRLASFTMKAALAVRPEMRVQAATWIRRGKLHLAATFMGSALGELLVDIKVLGYGDRVDLSTVQKSATITHESWDVTWLAEEGELAVSEVRHRTVRGAESFSYADEVPVLHESVEGAQLAGMDFVGLRAAHTFRRYHDDLVAAPTGSAGYLQSVHFSPAEMPDAPILR